MEQTENTLEVDLSEMNFAALNGLRERIDEKVREMREVGGPALREKFTEEAAAIGMTIEEIVQTGQKRRGRLVIEVNARHPPTRCGAARCGAREKGRE